MTATKSAKRERTEAALERLRGILKPGDTVYGIVRSVSKSGMSRRIDFYALKDNQHVFLTSSMADLGIGSYSTEAWRRSQGMRVDGCGMDMIFACVYELGRILWPNGDGKYKTRRNGDTGPETDGGYLLHHSQL